MQTVIEAEHLAMDSWIQPAFNRQVNMLHNNYCWTCAFKNVALRGQIKKVCYD